MMRWSVAASLLTVACTSRTVIEVEVTAREGLPSADTLVVGVADDETSIGARFDISGQSFPLSFTVTADDRGPNVDLVVTAVSGAIPVAQARASAQLSADSSVSVTTQLEPADFVVNSATDGNQRTAFRPGRNGRAVTQTQSGFAVAFVNDCLTGSVCDVFVRKFDDTGAPLELAGSDAETSVNTAPEPRVSVPAIAENGIGELAVVWETDNAIRVSRFDTAGALATVDVAATAITVENPVDPALLGTESGFILSWFQERDTPIEAGLHARPLTGGALGGLTAIREEGAASTVTLAPASAGAAIAWAEGDSLLAQVGAVAIGAPVAVATFTNEFVNAPQIAALSSGYVISYGRQADGVSQGLMLTLLEAGGAHVRDVVVSETSERPTDRPSVAVLGEDRVGVVWTACEGEGSPDRSGCAILGRVYDADLSPLTEPFIVNSESRGDQFEPAIAATSIGFVVVWTDNSGAPPDANLAVRARVFYLDSLL